MVIWELLESHTAVSTVCLGVIAVTIVALLKQLATVWQTFRYFQSFPGDPNFSLLYGNLHKLPKTGEARLAYGRYNMDVRHSKFARMWIGPFQPTIVVYHPDTVKVILKSSAPKSRGFGHTYEHAIPWIGEGLIASNGATWARSRRLLTPAFYFDVLQHYIEIYNQAADILFEKLDKLAESGESFDICPLMTLCTLDVILKCAMSYDGDIQRLSEHPYAQAARELVQAWATRSRTPYLWPSWIFRLTAMGRQFYKNCDYVHKVAEDIIVQRRLHLNKGVQVKKRHLDFLDILLTAQDEDGSPMTNLEIRNEVDTFLFAGHDTTATSLPWILHCLVHNPKYQVQVQNEVDLLGDGFVKWADLTKLKTLSLCIKEAMRLYPPVPFIQRKLHEDAVIEGMKIPRGTNITIAIVHLHRNPQVWEYPDEFHPERFELEDTKGRDSFAFTPFSAGSRNCIGQNFALIEEKIIIARILKRYTLESAPDGPPVARSAQAVLKSENGIWLKIKRRDS